MSVSDCPFCGATLVAVVGGIREGLGIAVVECAQCGALGPEATTRMAAVRAWNSRRGNGLHARFVAAGEPVGIDHPGPP